jgi:integrase
VHHAALAFAKVPAFVHDLRDLEAASVVTKLAFEFLILTAARTSEVIGARWEEFDLEAKLWVVPAARIKAGREHQVPLSTRCVELLARAQELRDGGPFVFPGRSLHKPLSNMVFLKTLERMSRDITAHGFRSAFRDWAAERTHFSRAVCEASLAHVVSDKVEAAYLRTSFLEQRRELMATWAAFATSKPADVVTLRA